MAANDILVNAQLSVHRVLQRKLGAGLGIQPLAEGNTQFVIFCQSGQCLAQRLMVTGFKEKAIDAVVDQVGDAADCRGYGCQFPAGTFCQGIGEGFGETGQRVDIQRGVETVHTAGDPTGKANHFFDVEFPCQSGQLVPFLAVTGDDQPQTGTIAVGGGKSADQRGHIFDRIHACGDTYHYAVLIHIQPQITQIAQPIFDRCTGSEVDAVVERIEAIGGEVSPNEQIYHGIGDTNVIV